VVKGNGPRSAIKQGIDKALSIQEVEGVFIIYQGHVGTAGKIPKIIKVASEHLKARRKTQ
jgi:ApbE superfamily uncharacterized protein (UPF0280 family)